MDPTPNPLREQGLQALRDGRLDHAIDILGRSVMASDDDTDARALLGVAYSQKGLHEQAKRALEIAVSRAPRNPSFHFNLGVALERAGDLQGAVIAYRDTLRLSRDHPQAQARLRAMGPQAAALLASAPKPPPEVGVPLYGMQRPGPAASPFESSPAMGASTPGSGAYPMPPYNPAYEAPAANPVYQPSPQPNYGEAQTGAPGSVECPRCLKRSRPGLACDWCSGPLSPPAASPVAAPHMSRPAYVHTPASGYAYPGYASPGAGFFPAQQMDSGEAFGRRLAARFIDGVIMGVMFITGLVVTFAATGTPIQVEPSNAQAMVLGVVYLGLPLLLLLTYDAGMIAVKGQTLGKMALGIRVVGPGGANPGYFRAAGRETIGKLVSSVVCFLGFLWMLWDPQQQTWHDKICDTTVVRA